MKLGIDLGHINQLSDDGWMVPIVLLNTKPDANPLFATGTGDSKEEAIERAIEIVKCVNTIHGICADLWKDRIAGN